MPFHDLTEPLREGMPVFPGDPPFERRVLRALERGDPFELSWIGLSAHAGTHVDPPAHFVRGGRTVDALPLDALVGEAVLLELADLDAATSLPPIVLLRTAGPRGFAPLPLAAARKLADAGVHTVGTDAPSLDPEDSTTFDTHRALAERDVVAIVNLKLANVPPGRYTFACLPLLIEGGDGAPARAVVWDENAARESH